MEQGVQLFVFRDKIRCPHDFTSIHLWLTFGHVHEKIFDVQNTDYPVNGAFYNRNSRKSGIDYLFRVKRYICIHNKHVGSWRHDFIGIGIVKLEYVVNQFFFFLLDFPFFFHHFHKGYQFFFGDGVRFFDTAGEPGDEIEKLDHREKKQRQPVYRIDGNSGDEKIVPGCDGFGKNFPEDQDQEGHATSGDSHCKIWKSLYGEGGGKGCRTDIDQIVSD